MENPIDQAIAGLKSLRTQGVEAKHVNVTITNPPSEVETAPGEIRRTFSGLTIEDVIDGIVKAGASSVPPASRLQFRELTASIPYKDLLSRVYDAVQASFDRHVL